MSWRKSSFVNWRGVYNVRTTVQDDDSCVWCHIWLEMICTSWIYVSIFMGLWEKIHEEYISTAPDTPSPSSDRPSSLTPCDSTIYQELLFLFLGGLAGTMTLVLQPLSGFLDVFDAGFDADHSTNVHAGFACWLRSIYRSWKCLWSCRQWFRLLVSSYRRSRNMHNSEKRCHSGSLAFIISLVCVFQSRRTCFATAFLSLQMFSWLASCSLMKTRSAWMDRKLSWLLFRDQCWYLHWLMFLLHVNLYWCKIKNLSWHGDRRSLKLTPNILTINTSARISEGLGFDPQEGRSGSCWCGDSFWSSEFRFLCTIQKLAARFIGDPQIATTNKETYQSIVVLVPSPG